MAQSYRVEWTLETVDADGDILEVEFFTSYAETKGRVEKFAAPSGHTYDIGLVKYYIAPRVGDPDRAYAYIGDDGRLEHEFDDGTVVPKKYKAEIK